LAAGPSGSRFAAYNRPKNLTDHEACVPIETRCPACGRKLKAPDALLGKAVRCPNCQQSFTVDIPPLDEAPAETAVTERPEEPRRKAPRRDDASVTARSGEARRKRSRVDDEDDDDRPRRRRYEDKEDDFDDDERYERKRRKQRRREAAAGSVMGPAIALMCVGGIAMLLAMVSLVLNLMGAALLAAPQVQAGGGGGPDAIANAVGGVAGAIFGICWGGIVLSGAWSMMRLRGYGYAMASTIVAMLPCTLCCLLGLPFGIWSLVVLCRPDVRDAFR
jgi:hypothetical protein